MTAIVPVVIVGAGPTGLTAATLLAQRGIHSLVFERHTETYLLPRAVHVDDEVLRILQQLGIAEEFAAISRPAAGLRLLDARHRVIAEFRRDRLEGVHGHPQANLFDQPDLERLLRQNLSRYPGIELRHGVEVVSVEQGDGDAVVRFRDVSGDLEGPPESIRARAVLGCDGANSAVRRMIGSRLEDLGFEERWLVVDVRTPSRLKVWNGVEQVCDPRRAATCMQIGPERYRWEFRMHLGESAAELAAPERLSALIEPWLGDGEVLAPAGGVRTVRGDEPFEVQRCAEYTFRARLADRWRKGTVFLLGDAAHLTPPFIGQGLGSGLRDAQNLAWKLARVLSGDPDEALLDSYQAERRPHARALIRLAVLTGWAMTGGQDRAAVLRRALLGVGCRLPGVSGLITSNTSPRLEAGPLIDRKSLREKLFGSGGSLLPGRDLAGTLCPQPWVRSAASNGSRRRLDDVLGLSFAVLADGPIDAALLARGTQLGARLIQLSRSDPDSGSDPDPHRGWLQLESPELRRWMARARVGTLLLRPDRVVLAAAGYGD